MTSKTARMESSILIVLAGMPFKGNFSVIHYRKIYHDQYLIVQEVKHQALGPCSKMQSTIKLSGYRLSEYQ